MASEDYAFHLLQYQKLEGTVFTITPFIWTYQTRFFVQYPS
jgi:hypothetical protein